MSLTTMADQPPLSLKTPSNTSKDETTLDDSLLVPMETTSSRFDIPKNTNKEMFYTNQKYRNDCVICGREKQNIQSHYEKIHPKSESFISRLSPAMAEAALNKTPNETAPATYTCLICEKPYKRKQQWWMEHYATHMGQPIYQCVNCNLYCNREYCTNKCTPTAKYKQVLKLNYTVPENDLLAYMCSLCNYVQLTERRMFRHLENEHGKMDDDENNDYVKEIELFVRKVIPKMEKRQRDLIDPMFFCQPPRKHRKTEPILVVNDIKNTDIEMCSSNAKYQTKCVLCDVNNRFMVNHYVKFHPNKEVYISRLSRAQVEAIKSGVKQSKTNNETNRVEGFCVFCEETYDRSDQHWIQHVTTHTGEYCFQCSFCGLKLNVNKHSCLAVGSDNLEKIHNFAFDADGFYGHICQICNYVQIRQEGLEKHLETEHQIPVSEASQHFEKIKLVDLPLRTLTAEPEPASDTIQDPLEIKNNNKEMYFSNPDYQKFCVICKKTVRRARNAVAHYVSSKHSEVFISRISDEYVKRLAITAPTTKIDANNRIAATCPFCITEKALASVDSWLQHLSSHTGEFMYQCQRSQCMKLMPYQSAHEKCGGRSLAKKIEIDAEIDDAGINGYICKICNYVQLASDRLKVHVENHHDVQSPESLQSFMKIILITLPKMDKIRLQINQSVPRAPQLPLDVPKNIDKNMQFINEDCRKKCMLCQKTTNPALAVAHYVNDHPDSEVFVSRLSSKMVDLCCSGNLKISTFPGTQFCVFCEKDYEKPIKYHLIEHLSTHTGEYSCECSLCHHKSSRANGHICKLGESTVIDNKCIKFEDQVLYAYLCKLCNYVQFQSNNVKMHVISQHEISEEEFSNHVQKIIVLDSRKSSAKLTIDYKNNDKNVCYSNRTYQTVCVLCATSTTNIINHYVRNHTELEMPIARISAEMMLICTAGKLEKANCTGIGGKQSAFCVFCEKERQFGKLGWLDHMSWHVGQFRYKCQKCNLTFANRNNHNQSRTCTSKPEDMTEIKLDVIEGDFMYAFACILCNFVQMDRQRLIQHIRDHHEVNDLVVEKHCRKIPVLNASFGDRVASLTKNKNDRDTTKRVSSEANLSACIYCNRLEADLVKHCVKKHPTEDVYTSCLTEQMMRLCTTALPMATKDERGIKAFCVFCEKHVVKQRSYWVEHLTSHTGDYQYECTKCGKVNSKRDHTRCDPREIKRVHQFVLEEDNRLSGFVCKMCGFVQLNEERIVEHVHKRHSVAKGEEIGQYDKLLLLNLFKSRSPNKAVNKSTDSIDNNKEQNQSTNQSWPVVLNNNPSMYLTHPDCPSKCVVCGEEPRYLSAHYAKVHGENYLSRLSDRMMQMAVERTNVAKLVFSGDYDIMCPFCEDNVSTKRSSLMKHIIAHTGEYEFQCKICKKPSLNPSNSCCNKTNYKRNHHFKFEDNALKGYACQICNYVQLSKDHLMKHMENNHPGQSANDCVSIELITFRRSSNSSSTSTVTSESYVGHDTSEPQPSTSKQATLIETEYAVEIKHDESLNISHCLDETFDQQTEYVPPVIESEMDETDCVYEEANATINVQLEDSPEAVENDQKIPKEEPINYVWDVTDSDDSNVECVPISKSSDVKPLRKNKPNNTQPSGEIEIIEILSDSEDEYGATTPSKPTTPAVGVRQLKPWTDTVSSKTAEVMECLLWDTAMFATYKCMGRDCVFTSNCRDIMEQHLLFHEQYQNTAMSEAESALVCENKVRDYLECAYCHKIGASIKELMDHISEVHGNSAYQCQYCFYRSIDAYSVVVHLQIYHRGQESVVLFCTPNDQAIDHDHKRFNRAKSEQINEALKLLAGVVKPIQCELGK